METDEVRQRGWPRSAWLTAVALSCVLIVVLVLWVTDSRLFSGSYRPEHGGTIADWFGALGALLAVPLALLIANRVRADERRAFVAEQEERFERRQREWQHVRDALHAELQIVTVVEADEDGNDIEPELAREWRSEMATRGWRNDPVTGLWKHDGEECTTRELVAKERTDLVPQPWTILAVCRNHGSSAVTLKEFVVELSGGRRRAIGPLPSTLPPGSVARACVRGNGGRPVRYKTISSAAGAVRAAAALFENETGPEIRVDANLPGGRT